MTQAAKGLVTNGGLREFVAAPSETIDAEFSPSTRPRSQLQRRRLRHTAKPVAQEAGHSSHDPHDNSHQVYSSTFVCHWRKPIDFCRHDEIVLVETLDLLGAQ
jgi:hypothetical protein